MIRGHRAELRSRIGEVDHGRQAVLDIHKDNRTLAARTVELVKDLQQGSILPTNTDSVDNGTVNVPSYLIPPITVT
jgi:ABC-type xylose transport system substrate-binding protein